MYHFLIHIEIDSFEGEFKERALEGRTMSNWRSKMNLLKLHTVFSPLGWTRSLQQADGVLYMNPDHVISFKSEHWGVQKLTRVLHVDEEGTVGHKYAIETPSEIKELLGLEN